MKNKNKRIYDNTKTNRLIITEWVTLAGILVSCFYLVHADVRAMDARMLAQQQRTDRLYEMWCDTQKEIKQIYVERFTIKGE